MGIRTRIFFITLLCLFIGISLSFVVAERDLSLKLQDQIETELESIGAKFEIFNYNDLINQTSEYLSNE